LLGDFLPDDLAPEAQRNGVGEPAFRVRPEHHVGRGWSARRSSSACSRLEETGKRTAEILGISTRTLLRKIRTYELRDPVPDSPLSEGNPPS